MGYQAPHAPEPEPPLTRRQRRQQRQTTDRATLARELRRAIRMRPSASAWTLATEFHITEAELRKLVPELAELRTSRPMYGA